MHIDEFNLLLSILSIAILHIYFPIPVLKLFFQYYWEVPENLVTDLAWLILLGKKIQKYWKKCSNIGKYCNIYNTVYLKFSYCIGIFEYFNIELKAVLQSLGFVLKVINLIWVQFLKKAYSYYYFYAITCNRIFNSRINTVIINTKNTCAFRIWWLSSFALSVVLCATAILNIWTRWSDHPVAVTFDDKTTQISDIPFPAVTICTSQKFREEHFDEGWNALKKPFSDQ